MGKKFFLVFVCIILCSCSGFDIEDYLGSSRYQSILDDPIPFGNIEILSDDFNIKEDLNSSLQITASKNIIIMSYDVMILDLSLNLYIDYNVIMGTFDSMPSYLYFFENEKEYHYSEYIQSSDGGYVVDDDKIKFVYSFVVENIKDKNDKINITVKYYGYMNQP